MACKKTEDFEKKSPRKMKDPDHSRGRKKNKRRKK